LKICVVPELSRRTILVTGTLQFARAGLSATSAASVLQLRMSPPKSRETSLPVRFSAVGAGPPRQSASVSRTAIATDEPAHGKDMMGAVWSLASGYGAGLGLYSPT